MKKILAFLSFALFFGISFAQGTAEQTQNASANAANSATNQGVVTNVITNSAPNTSSLNSSTVENKGHTRVDTTPSVFAPGNSVSNGAYNCGATDSFGIAVTGAGVAGGKARELPKCPRFYMMDKAKERALNAKGEVADPRFVKVWDALYCMDEEGAEAYRLAGITCPQEEAKARQNAATMQIMQKQVITDVMTGKPVGQ